jgi:peptide/nickel transport system permease protein
VIIAVAVTLAVFGGLLAPQDPEAQDLAASATGPSAAHPLGTDELGRDVLSRVVAGARTALVGPLAIALGAALLGNALGLLAGYRGGRVDAAIMRWADFMYSVPGLLVAVVVVGVIGGGYWVAIVVLVLLSAPYDARLIRGVTLAQRRLPYVEAAELRGVPGHRIMWLEIWPNVAPLAIASAVTTFAFAIVALASLSFLGIGVAPGEADWGRMLFENKPLLYDNASASVAPAIAIVLLTASVSLLGDRIYEQVADRGRAR